LALNAGGAASIVTFANNGSNSFSVSLSGLKLTGASSAAITGQYVSGLGTITLDQLEISENQGSALNVSGETLTVTNSTIANNQTGSGAAIVLSSGTNTFINDTISGNQSTGATAGLSVSYSGVTLRSHDCE